MPTISESDVMITREGVKKYIYTVYTLGKCQTLALQTGLMSLNSVSNIGMTPAPPEREREKAVQQ